MYFILNQMVQEGLQKYRYVEMRLHQMMNGWSSWYYYCSLCYCILCCQLYSVLPAIFCAASHILSCQPQSVLPHCKICVLLDITVGYRKPDYMYVFTYASINYSLFVIIGFWRRLQQRLQGRKLKVYFLSTDGSLLVKLFVCQSLTLLCHRMINIQNRELRSQRERKSNIS